MKFISQKLRALLLLAASFLTVSQLSAEEKPVYELRIYTTNEGKLPDLLKRFREHTCQLFAKHGMTNIGYWVPIDEENGSKNTLIYLLRHSSRQAAAESFKAFGNDPEWKAVKEASEANGKILAKPPESIFLTTTAYSPEILLENKEPRAFELRTYKTNPGKLDALHARFTNYTMQYFSRHGMTHIGYWTPTDADKGADDTLIYILAHPSKEAGLKAFTSFRADPDWIKAKGESEKDGSLTVPQPNGVKSVYMEAVDFSPIR